MTEDILFDNIYVGHSIDDTKALAAETFDIKHSLEKAAEKSAFPGEDEEELDEVTFAENPVDFLRNKAYKFIVLAQTDPVAALKTQPETGAAVCRQLYEAHGPPPLISIPTQAYFILLHTSYCTTATSSP
jgi:hypothetical protein